MQHKKRKGECVLSHTCSNGILAFALNCSNDGIVLLDDNDKVLFINQKFEEWTDVVNSTWNHKPFPLDALFLENSEKELFKNILKKCKEEGKDCELTFGFKYQADNSEQRMTVTVKRHDNEICCMFKLLEHFSFSDKQKLEFYEIADAYLPEFSVGRYEPDKDDVLSMFSSLRAKKKKQDIGCTQMYNRYYIADLKFKNCREWVDVVSTVGPNNPVATFESLVAYPGGPDTYMFLICHFVKEDEYGRKLVVTLSDPTARKQANMTKHNVEVVSEITSSMKHMLDDPEVISGTLQVVDDGTEILLKVQSNSRFLGLDALSEPKRLSQLAWTREDIEMWLTKCSECTSRKSVMFEFRPQHVAPEIFRCLMLHVGANSYAIVMIGLSGRKELETKLNQHKHELQSQVYRYTKELDEALQVKSNFLAVMSHEMRTPLSGILATLSLLNETPLNGDQKELVRIGEVCGQQLLLVINDILDYGKLDANKVVLDWVPFQLKNALEESVEVVSFEAQKKGLDLMSCIDASVPDTIVGDPGRLGQILVNLLSNAVKFSIHGEVVLSARAVSSRGNDGFVDSIEISVKDEGIGIEESQKHKLFQAFSQVDSSTTRRHAGTGLGLSISKRLAELMGGKVWFTSKVGVGSTFYLQVPLGRDKNALQPVSMHVELGPATPVSILIIEKSQTLLNHLNQMLEFRGFRSYCTSSLEKAQEYFPSDQLKLILVDARCDMNSIRALLKTQKASLYLLGNSPLNKQQGSEQPLPFIRKPITINSLMKVVFREHNMPVEDDRKVAVQTSFGGTTVISLSDIVGTHKILLAEDNVLNQQIIMKMLHSIGFKKENIFVADNGKLAVDFVRQSPRGFLDVVLMDIMMPEMGGLEATEIIRKEFGQYPVIIALTANAFAEDKVKCLQCGMSNVLTKPVNKQELIDTLLKFATLKKHNI